MLFYMLLFEGGRDLNVVVLVAPFPLKLKRVNIQKVDNYGHHQKLFDNKNKRKYAKGVVRNRISLP